MKTFSQWAEHYGYQDNPASRADYALYVTELRQLGRMSTAFSELDRAADHLNEMRDILKNGDGPTSLLSAYADALDALTLALKHGSELLSRE